MGTKPLTLTPRPSAPGAAVTSSASAAREEASSRGSAGRFPRRDPAAAAGCLRSRSPAMLPSRSRLRPSALPAASEPRGPGGGTTGSKVAGGGRRTNPRANQSAGGGSKQKGRGHGRSLDVGGAGFEGRAGLRESLAVEGAAFPFPRCGAWFVSMWAWLVCVHAQAPRRRRAVGGEWSRGGGPGEGRGSLAVAWLACVHAHALRRRRAFRARGRGSLEVGAAVLRARAPPPATQAGVAGGGARVVWKMAAAMPGPRPVCAQRAAAALRAGRRARRLR